MKSEPIKLFIVDDHTLVRQGLSAILEHQGDINVVGQCGDGSAAVEQILGSSPDVVLLDLSLPGLNGLEVCRRLSKASGSLSILVLTMHAEEEYVAEAFRGGACGYLLKEAASEQLVEAVRKAAAGEVFLSPGISPRILRRLASKPSDDLYTVLTPREREVLKLIADGKSNRLIADQLGLSVKTVDTHRWRLMRKLNIHDQTSLVKYAIRKGLSSLG